MFLGWKLTRQDSNLEPSGPEPDVLPIRPRVNDVGNVISGIVGVKMPSGGPPGTIDRRRRTADLDRRGCGGRWVGRPLARRRGPVVPLLRSGSVLTGGVGRGVSSRRSGSALVGGVGRGVSSRRSGSAPARVLEHPIADARANAPGNEHGRGFAEPQDAAVGPSGRLEGSLGRGRRTGRTTPATDTRRPRSPSARSCR